MNIDNALAGFAFLLLSANAGAQTYFLASERGPPVPDPEWPANAVKIGAVAVGQEGERLGDALGRGSHSR